MRRLVTSLIAAACLATPVMAQDAETLADIRQQLVVLYSDIQQLKQELNTTGGAAQISGGTVLDRVNAMETALQRLTSKTEELEYRIGRVTTDGTKAVSNLEFRLCELEPACDIGSLGDTPTLGGETASVVPATPAPATTVVEAGPELAIGEKAHFTRAQEALQGGDYALAADEFASFNTTYPGGPLAAAADLGRGEALEKLGDTREAARAFLSSFSLDQSGPTAPAALFRLGASLGRLGQTNEACVTLSEVSRRYPDAVDAVNGASSSMQEYGCS